MSSELEESYNSLRVAQKALVDNLKAQIKIHKSEDVVLEIAHDPRFKDIGVLTLYKDGLIAWIEPGTYRLTRIEDDPDQEVWDYLDKGGI